MARTMFKRRPRNARFREERRRKLAEEAAMAQRGRIDLALKHFHDSNDDVGTEYEFVRDAGCGCGCVRYGLEWFRHINFLAKPKGASDDEVKLFFAEIQKAVVTPPVVISCSILGPEGVVTGGRGCKACEYEGKAVVQHPVDGEFTRGLHPVTAFYPLLSWE